MSRRRKTIALSAVVALIGIILSGTFWNRLLRIKKQEKEAHMVSIHYEAWSQYQDFKGSDGAPRNIYELLDIFGNSATAMLLRPFPDGLTYQPNESGFRLEEPKPHHISLFHSDRLVATESKWARWEKSGEYAKKFDDQEIPEDMK